MISMITGLQYYGSLAISWLVVMATAIETV